MEEEEREKGYKKDLIELIVLRENMASPGTHITCVCLLSALLVGSHPREISAYMHCVCVLRLI